MQTKILCNRSEKKYFSPFIVLFFLIEPFANPFVDISLTFLLDDLVVLQPLFVLFYLK